MNKKIKLAMALAVILIVIVFVVIRIVQRSGSDGKLMPLKPSRGDLTLTVSTIGTVKPQNRLEIKPPINGRVEKILVKEGQEVKDGEVLALMSSTERAALIDAARLKGDKEFKYWQQAYKETPLVAPIDGVVIVRDVEPGQTVSTSDAILVLSDRLIVEADVDETDIGELKVGQKAVISLDAYPDIKVDAIVDHISYESEVVSNVTIYKVDMLPREIPKVFRSGMSANVEVIVKEAEGALLVPSEALIREKNKTYVWIKDPSEDAPKKRQIAVGLESEGFVEIKAGVSDGDIIYAPKRSYVVPKKKNGTTPFLPSFRRRDKKR
ncbi:MAG: efflux RND transporter periplasmic adaptor subunit [Thermoplasmata archaeon]|nr:efflux RND transporter periplasmic adaptor subunit [Thermoplasmata archaeon]